MALDTRTFRLALTVVFALVFLQLTGCSEILQAPFAPADGSIGAATGDTRGAPSGETLTGEAIDARSDRILKTRVGELLTADDVTLVYNPDDLPPGVEPSIIFPDPTRFQFTILPTGVEARHFIQVHVNYSKADMEGIDESDLGIWGMENEDYRPYTSALDTDNSIIGYKTIRFARYALARD